MHVMWNASLTLLDQTVGTGLIDASDIKVIVENRVCRANEDAGMLLLLAETCKCDLLRVYRCRDSDDEEVDMFKDPFQKRF